MPRKIALPSFDPRDAAARILDLYRSATAEELVDGAGWYARAHSLAVELDPQNVTRGAAVLAILSPRRSWPQNVALARSAYETDARMREAEVTPEGMAFAWSTFPTTGDQRGKLARLFAGEDPDAVVGGPKVRSFWQTISDPSKGGDAVIDRHAMAVAQGRVMNEDELKINKAEYAAYVEAYAIAATVLSVAPAIVQAVTWIRWRHINKINFAGDFS
jgi:hypothetical protein